MKAKQPLLKEVYINFQAADFFYWKKSFDLHYITGIFITKNQLNQL
jgi:hypothetical protein